MQELKFLEWRRLLQSLKEHCSGTRVATHTSKCGSKTVRKVSMNLLSTFASTLGYEFDALEPVLSRETVQYHFIQHQRRCYERTAAMVKETELESIPLESLVRVTGKQPGHRYLFTLAAEAWNHELYWRSLQPAGGGVASGPIGQDIQRTFGDFSTFLCRATEAARAVIGGGWLWVTWG